MEGRRRKGCVSLTHHLRMREQAVLPYQLGMTSFGARHWEGVDPVTSLLRLKFSSSTV
jgi:hypothetical protein